MPVASKPTTRPPVAVPTARHFTPEAAQAEAVPTPGEAVARLAVALHASDMPALPHVAAPLPDDQALAAWAAQGTARLGARADRAAERALCLGYKQATGTLTASEAAEHRRLWPGTRRAVTAWLAAHQLAKGQRA